MRRCFSAVLAAALLLTGCRARIVQRETKSVDETVYTRESADIRLEDDFYGYENFDLLYGGSIPADMTELSAGILVNKQVEDILSAEISSIAQGEGYPQGSDEQKIHDLYWQYLDWETRDAVGLEPLEMGFAAIDRAQTPAELARAFGLLYRNYGVAVLPAVRVSQDSYDSGRNSVCISRMELFYSSDELLNGKDSAEGLQRQMTELLTALETVNAGEIAADTVTMLLDIAGSTADLSALPLEDTYHVLTPGELDPIISEYLEVLGLDGRDTVVNDTVQLERICALMTPENLPLWKALGECELIYAYSKYLPGGYAEALREAGGTDEEKALSAVKMLLAGELGNIYAAGYLQEDTLRFARQLTEDVVLAYRRNIETSGVLSESDRKECLAKIDALTLNIGCPGEQYHSTSVISGSLLESVVSLKSAGVQDNLSQIDRKPQPTDWYMFPQTVNALYRPQSNSITIPMALFNAPYLDPEGDYYSSLGGLGSVIAHEIGHAFDGEGILYDEHGNYRPERISSDRTDLLSRRVSEYFGSWQMMGTFYVDGEKTSAENAADLGGMQIIASMTDRKDELGRIFESYANIWATLSFDTSAARQMTEDSHSPAEIRVNAVLASVDKFYEVYGIEETDGMYVPPEKRVRMW